MSEWKEYKLQDAIEKFIDYRGKTPNKVNKGIPLITAKVIKDGSILKPDEFIKESEYLSWMTRGFPEINDVLLTTEAPLGEVAIINDKNIALAQRIILLRGKPKLLNNNFLFYSLRDGLMQHRLKARASGSTVQGIKSSELKEVMIPLPDIEEQKRIANILSCLDAKIDNLRRQNETLEEIARSIFKHWFIDFEFPNADGKPYKSSGGVMVRSDLGDIPEGWRVGKLGDVALFNNGKSSPERSDDFNIPIYGSNGVIGKASKSNYQNIVIIGRVGSYCGSLYYFLDKCWVTDNAMIGRLINKTSHAFLYFVLQKIQLNRLSTGSGQPLLNQTILSSIEWALPTNICIESFENTVKSIFEKTLSNNNQLQTLTKTRDTLLPKLMSGQLRVKE